jgi:hypothetical protein
VEEEEEEKERRRNLPISRSQASNSYMLRWKRAVSYYDRIAVGAFRPVRLKMTLVNELDFLRGSQPRQRKGTGHTQYSLSGRAARVPSRSGFASAQNSAARVLED